MNLLVEKSYLHLPVRNGAEMRRMSVIAGGQLARQFEIELADSKPDFWAFLDISMWRGQEIQVVVDPPLANPAFLASLVQSNTVPQADSIYHEKSRPQFHFTSRRGWNNDPNGLLYYQGEYHLFYQHNPFGIKWGNMHWGHATSRDLLHWQELTEALYQDETGMMWSGSGVVDANNTSGFKSTSADPLVLIYTAAGGFTPQSQGKLCTQCLAYSNDRGVTWNKYAGNPVLPNLCAANRDPKVFWHAPTGKWIMALFLEQDYALYTSPDLKHWEHILNLSIPGSTECPDLFELPVGGDPENTRWVFYGANNNYLIGRFDGMLFIQECAVTGFTANGDSYAAQSWSDIPPEDGRRIQISWLRFPEVPGMPFSQQMTFPVELSLRETDEGIRLFAEPVKELELLRRPLVARQGLSLCPGENPLAGISGDLFEIRVDVRLDSASEIGMVIRGLPVLYDVQKQLLSCRDRSCHLAPFEGKISLQFLIDRLSIEIFANHGRVYLPLGVIFPDENRSLEMWMKGGRAFVEVFEVFELASIWEGRTEENS